MHDNRITVVSQRYVNSARKKNAWHHTKKNPCTRMNLAKLRIPRASPELVDMTENLNTHFEVDSFMRSKIIEFYEWC